MEYYKASELKKIARDNVTRIISEGKMYKIGSKKETKEMMFFDIFIAHSKLDQNIIKGLYVDLNNKFDIDVYVDWIVDPHLSRNNVNTKSAFTLRKRMDKSESLLYAVSGNSLTSVWTPWELGYFDGSKKLIKVLPILNDYESDFHGTEYVGIYEIIDKNEINTLFNNLDSPKFFSN